MLDGDGNFVVLSNDDGTDISKAYGVLKSSGLSRDISSLIQDFLGNVSFALDLIKDENILRAYNRVLSLVINRQVKEVVDRVTKIIGKDNPKDIDTNENIRRFADEFGK